MSGPSASGPGAGWMQRVAAWVAPWLGTDSGASDELPFSPDFLTSLERLRFAALRALGGGMGAGHRLGAYKGGQLEFHGHRTYAAGDELRYLDWNSYARLDKPFVKEFAREESGVLHLLLDATPSMALGRPSKWAFARRTALLLAHVALSSQDRVQLRVFRSGGLERFPRRGQRVTTPELLRFLEGQAVEPPLAQPAAGAGALSNAARAFLAGGAPRGRVIVLSDFWSDERDLAAAVSRLASAGCDPAGVHILAREELVPAVSGPLRIQSPEEPGAVLLQGSATLQTQYAEELRHHVEKVTALFRSRGGDCLFAENTTALESVLLQLLRQRRWLA